MPRPGVMFYFDMRPSIKRLSKEEKGILFEAILDYAELGVVPAFDGMLGIAWDFIQPRLDRDESTYSNKVAQKKYAVYVREVKRKGGKPEPFYSWKQLSTDISRYQPITDDTECYPTTTPTTAPTTTTATESTIKEDTTQKIKGCTKEDRCREETPTLSPAPIPSQRPHWLPEPDYSPSEADMEARKLSMIELLRGKEANYRCNSL